MLQTVVTSSDCRRPKGTELSKFLSLYDNSINQSINQSIDRLVWTEAARKEEGVPWYTGVLLGAERFIGSWHKSEEEVTKLREVNRAA